MKSIFDKEKFNMAIGEIMTKHVISVRPHTSAEVCARLMIENKIGSVVVVDDKEKIVGIITKENLIKHVLAQNASAEIVKAFEVMSSPVITASPSISITQAMHKMFKEGIRHLIVTNSEGKLVGICTDTDIFKVVPTLIFLEQEYLKIVEQDQNQPLESIAGYCDDCKEYSDSLTLVDGKYLCPDCLPEEYQEISPAEE
ncbi:MAG: CBS domain-containing protein [Candidatus Heimdallarchaeaceae archaeon]